MGNASGSADSDGHDMAGLRHILAGNPIDFRVMNMKVIEGPISGAPKEEIIKSPRTREL
jgi:hypothetical protein